MTEMDLFIAAVGANVGDVLTTKLALNRGLRESNPALVKLFSVFGSDFGLLLVLAAKIGICFAFYAYSVDLVVYGRNFTEYFGDVGAIGDLTMRWGNVGMLLLGLGLTINNWRIIQKYRK